MLETLARDVRYGLRALIRSPGYSLAVVLTLGLGIGANTAIFSLVNGVLLRPLPYAGGNELVVARQQALRAGSANIPFSVKEILDYRAQLGTLDGFVEYHGMSFTLLNRGEPDRVLTGVVSANFFDVLGVQPLHGRTFRDDDDDLGAEAVLVLSYPYWQQRFGGAPDVVGQVFEMNDRPHTVVGVLPPIPQYPRENDVYMPTSSGVGQQRQFAIEGRTYEDPDLRPELETRVISPDYFETVGVPLLAGRTFSQLDDAATLPVAVISRSLAGRHWRDGGSPIGQRITLDDGETWLTIVGVAGDVRDHGLDREPPDQLYRPFLQGAGTPTRVLVRARADPLALSGQVRDAVHAVDPEQPVENFRTLEETRAGTTATRRLSVVLLGLFAALALVISVTGIAAVIATSVSQRTREFGLRLALGARRASILAMVMRQGLVLVLAGLAVGAAGAFALSRSLSSFLFETEPTDVGILAAVSLMFVVTGLGASYLPARRAMAVDPLVALRDE